MPQHQWELTEAAVKADSLRWRWLRLKSDRILEQVTVTIDLRETNFDTNMKLGGVWILVVRQVDGLVLLPRGMLNKFHVRYHCWSVFISH